MRITLVRHGESEANVGNFDYTTMGDHKIALTARGHQQAQEAGSQLSDVIQRAVIGKALIYCSPYLRTRQTLEGIINGSGIPGDVRVFEDPRLRETDHGYDLVPDQKTLRGIHGWFYYRYDGGESPADCSDRISGFLESMMRQVRRKEPDEVLIVSHGLAIRCFVMRFMHLTVEQFEDMANPKNCDIITIDLKEDVSNPTYRSGRWAAKGIRLREGLLPDSFEREYHNTWAAPTGE